MDLYSPQSYRFLISLALERGYRISGFLEDDEQQEEEERRLYLRHDVDYSLSMALELARINASMNVRATFCLMLRSQVYNLLSHSSLDCAREIQSLGQRLALHYAPPPVPLNDDELAVMIQSDFEIVQRHLPEIEPAFAWHNPTPELFQRGLDFQLPRFVNIYSSRFVKEMPYYSDSNLRHSVEDFIEIVRDETHLSLHLLFHPLHWIAGGRDLREIFPRTWAYVIKEREQEFRENRTYRELYPEGMPDAVLQEFAEQWRRGAKKVSR